MKRPELDSLTSSSDYSATLDVFGEFQIESEHYLVICPKSCVQDSPSPDFYASQSTSPLTEVGQFLVNGQLFAIVKVDAPQSYLGIDLASLLTERELQIASLVALGNSNKQIAHQLRISEWTVSTHLRRIFVKLKVDSRAAMVYRCTYLIQKFSGFEAINPKSTGLKA